MRRHRTGDEVTNQTPYSTDQTVKALLQANVRVDLEVIVIDAGPMRGIVARSQLPNAR